MNLYSAIFEFNRHNRDAFIASFAGSLASGLRVLDAGAGPCQYRPLFSHCDYQAQDFARYEGSEHTYGELDYVCDITAIPIPDESYDCVICTEVLEHVPDPGRAIAELARLLRPGGKLLLTAPLGSGIHMAPYHYYGGFTPYWYRRTLPACGLELVECRANGGFFKLYGQESQRFLTQLTPTGRVGRVIFVPFKALLALWFRFVMPLACHFLDRLDHTQEFTAGYFVIAVKSCSRTTRL